MSIFIIQKTLKDRNICDDPEIIHWSLEQLLTLDDGTSQFASASVLMGNPERRDHPPELRLTNEESMNFSREHSEAMLLSMQAIEDYVSARCCIFNNLFTGLTIASQAIEKMLKAIIYMETKQKFEVKGNDRHKPFKLKEELKQAKDYNLDRFDDLLKRLYGYYQARYPDNDDKNKQLLLSDINESILNCT